MDTILSGRLLEERDEREGVRPNYDRPEAAVTYGNVHYKMLSSL